MRERHDRLDRRQFLARTTAAIAAAGLVPALAGCRPRQLVTPVPSTFDISLGEYSLHRTIASGELDHLDFAKHTIKQFGIDAVEYWSGPFQDKATDQNYLADMKSRAADSGVNSLLILVDGEGPLGDPDEATRRKAVENHFKWVEAAKTLGCHSIRVNAASRGEFEEQKMLAADGLRQLSEFAAPHDIGVIVENHGGLSSNGKWLAGVIEEVGLDNCGTLPDFGNFGDYDRYQGVAELMPTAKAVSAKSHKFDAEGNEVYTDFGRMMQIVAAAGYTGYVGIEYEGSKHTEAEGIRLTKALLERFRKEPA
ncbi:MAG: sugar phosphate isomerase/epimerase [Planctomycetota bacterium]|nr:MAG: sugar phosphate isomerase/epimerase [Planctomycetota bacterium]REJ96589.1 MAG: sugar phosphate isomerase/epimerase [Planctomycetota bacterium]REK21727.1 MAG: sugar phosphate isomerase/epimerase [Planctomycetota bacterium]REK43133.1 MAG: sugar phosphate isomerase/epimerase [Planctomycetota bacterium]